MSVLSLVFGGLLSCTMFITIGLALKFMFMPLQSPGRTAILAVDDRLLFMACAMIVMALVAVTPGTGSGWTRAIRRSSGTLPIAARRHRARQVEARWRCSPPGFALAAIAMPTLLHPPLMVGRLSIGLLAGLMLIVIHFVVSLAAGTVWFRRGAGGPRNTAAVFGALLHPGLAAIAQVVLIVGAGHVVPAGAGDPRQCRARDRGARNGGHAVAAVLVRRRA